VYPAAKQFEQENLITLSGLNLGYHNVLMDFTVQCIAANQV